MLDTDHEPEGFDAVFAELVKRGFSFDEIDEMRVLAWKTAGWLNYDLMLWDWVHLDEKDMRKALDLKLEKRSIPRVVYSRNLAQIQKFLDRDLPIKN